MKRLFIILMAGAAAGPCTFAGEQSMLARITVYWPSRGGVERASSNGARLQNGHCAVDPSKIPYGSKVIFPDLACLAIDSGPAVINRIAARRCATTAAQRAALVIDRYFETKSQALAWAASHPHFMTVRVLDPHHKIVQSTLAAIGSAANAASGAAKSSVPPPSSFIGNSGFAPADIRGGILPTFSGTALPRS